MNREEIPTAAQPIHQPKIYIGRLVGGSFLFLIGLVLLPTITITAIGIALCLVGGFLVAAAFANRKYGAAHAAHRVPQQQQRP